MAYILKNNVRPKGSQVSNIKVGSTEVKYVKRGDGKLFYDIQYYIEYDDPVISFNYSSTATPASGGSVSPTAKSFTQSWRRYGYSGYSYEQSSITSGATITYSIIEGTGASVDNTGKVTWSSRDTDPDENQRSVKVQMKVVSNGKTAYKTATIYQAKNVITSVTYGTPTGKSLAVPDIPASGGTVSSGQVSGTVSQTRTDTYSSGASTSYTIYPSISSSQYSAGVSANSLGTTPKDRTAIGTLTYSYVCNGQTGSCSATVYQQANVRTLASVYLSPYQPDSSWVVTVSNGNWNTCPASGGYLKSRGYANYTHTSGSNLNDQKITDDATLSWSGDLTWISKHSNGGYRVAGRGTSYSTSTASATGVWSYTYGSVTKTASKTITQAKNVITSVNVTVNAGSITHSAGTVAASGGTVSVTSSSNGSYGGTLTFSSTSTADISTSYGSWSVVYSWTKSSNGVISFTSSNSSTMSVTVSSRGATYGASTRSDTITRNLKATFTLSSSYNNGTTSGTNNANTTALTITQAANKVSSISSITVAGGVITYNSGNTVSAAGLTATTGNSTSPSASGKLKLASGSEINATSDYGSWSGPSYSWSTGGNTPSMLTITSANTSTLSVKTNSRGTTTGSARDAILYRTASYTFTVSASASTSGSSFNSSNSGSANIKITQAANAANASSSITSWGTPVVTIGSGLTAAGGSATVTVTVTNVKTYYYTSGSPGSTENVAGSVGSVSIHTQFIGTSNTATSGTTISRFSISGTTLSHSSMTSNTGYDVVRVKATNGGSTGVVGYSDYYRIYNGEATSSITAYGTPTISIGSGITAGGGQASITSSVNNTRTYYYTSGTKSRDVSETGQVTLSITHQSWSSSTTQGTNNSISRFSISGTTLKHTSTGTNWVYDHVTVTAYNKGDTTKTKSASTYVLNNRTLTGVSIYAAQADVSWWAVDKWNSIHAGDAYLDIRGKYHYTFTSGSTLEGDAGRLGSGMTFTTSMAEVHSNGGLHIKHRGTTLGDARTGTVYWTYSGLQSNTLQYTQVANVITGIASVTATAGTLTGTTCVAAGGTVNITATGSGASAVLNTASGSTITTNYSSTTYGTWQFHGYSSIVDNTSYASVTSTAYNKVVISVQNNKTTNSRTIRVTRSGGGFTFTLNDTHGGTSLRSNTTSTYCDITQSAGQVVYGSYTGTISISGSGALAAGADSRTVTFGKVYRPYTWNSVSGSGGNEYYSGNINISVAGSGHVSLSGTATVANSSSSTSTITLNKSTYDINCYNAQNCTLYLKMGTTTVKTLAVSIQGNYVTGIEALVSSEASTHFYYTAVDIDGGTATPTGNAKAIYSFTSGATYESGSTTWAGAGTIKFTRVYSATLTTGFTSINTNTGAVTVSKQTSLSNSSRSLSVTSKLVVTFEHNSTYSTGGTVSSNELSHQASCTQYGLKSEWMESTLSYADFYAQHKAGDLVWPQAGTIYYKYTNTANQTKSITVSSSNCTNHAYSVSNSQFYHYSSYPGCISVYEENRTGSTKTATVTWTFNYKSPYTSSTLTGSVQATVRQPSHAVSYSAITLNVSAPTISAAGGTVTAANITVTYSQTKTVVRNDNGNTETYTITSGFTPTKTLYNASGTVVSSVTGSNLDKTICGSAKKGSATVSLTMNGKTASKSVNINQEGNYVESVEAVADNTSYPHTYYGKSSFTAAGGSQKAALNASVKYTFTSGSTHKGSSLDGGATTFERSFTGSSDGFWIDNGTNASTKGDMGCYTRSNVIGNQRSITITIALTVTFTPTTYGSTKTNTNKVYPTVYQDGNYITEVTATVSNASYPHIYYNSKDASAGTSAVQKNASATYKFSSGAGPYTYAGVNIPSGVTWEFPRTYSVAQAATGATLNTSTGDITWAANTSTSSRTIKVNSTLTVKAIHNSSYSAGGTVIDTLDATASCTQAGKAITITGETLSIASFSYGTATGQYVYGSLIWPQCGTITRKVTYSDGSSQSYTVAKSSVTSSYSVASTTYFYVYSQVDGTISCKTVNNTGNTRTTTATWSISYVSPDTGNTLTASKDCTIYQYSNFWYLTINNNSGVYRDYALCKGMQNILPSEIDWSDVHSGTSKSWLLTPYVTVNIANGKTDEVSSGTVDIFKKQYGQEASYTHFKYFAMPATDDITFTDT